MNIFLKMVLCSLLIVFVWTIICKIQKPDGEIMRTELGERFIDWKLFSVFYLVVALGFTLIFLFALSFPSNLSGMRQGIMYGFFLILIAFFLSLSFLYGNVYVRIGKQNIQWRRMNGEKCEIRYENISSYTMDFNGNLKLYQDDKCILSFATGKHKIFVTEVLKNHGIPTRKTETLILKAGNGYVLFYLICCLCTTFLFLMSTYYGVLAGILLFFVCSLASFFLVLDALNHKIIITDNRILEKRIFRKRMIRFSEVIHLSLEKRNNTEIVCIHSGKSGVIKIPRYYQNIELFEDIISKKNWQWY